VLSLSGSARARSAHTGNLKNRPRCLFLRQVLARAVVWGMIDVNPAKVGVDNRRARPSDVARSRL
jgi:hypothetical protein